MATHETQSTAQIGSISISQLPEDGTFAQVHCLDGGSFVARWSFIHAGVEEKPFRLYNWAFHIHDIKPTDIYYGMRNLDDYSPWIQKFMKTCRAVGPRRSLEEQLARQNVRKNQIDSVVFSHAHFDHSRPINKEFPKATVYFGPGTKEHCSPGHFANPETIYWDGRFFDPVRATEAFDELDGPWVRFGAFEKAIDFFGTGSFWIAQAPGHMPGNLCAVVRKEGGGWIVLGSDCCHSRALLDGDHEIATWKAPGASTKSMHDDIPMAKDTMARIRSMESKLGCHVALAHDTEWMKDGRDEVLMGMLDDELKDAAKTKMLRDEVV